MYNNTNFHFELKLNGIKKANIRKRKEKFHFGGKLIWKVKKERKSGDGKVRLLKLCLVALMGES